MMKCGIIFSDVDGTLLDSEHRVQPGTLAAIRSLKEQGIPFVLISGRSPSGMRPILRDYGFSCAMICYSGALILDEDGRVLDARGFPPATAGRIIRHIETNRLDCTWNIFSMDTWIVKDRKDPRVALEESVVRARAAEGSVASLPPGAKVSKVLCMCSPEKIVAIEKSMKQAFPGLSITASSAALLEIMPPGVNKSTAVRTLCRIRGIPMDAAAAFGDHLNDIEMLETVAYPFLMGNAPESMKARFPRITADNDHEGIYTALLEAGVIRPAGGPGT